MKVLILTVSAGEGHNSMGKAVQEYLSDKVDKVEMYDLFVGKSWINAKIANDLYFFVCKYFYNLSNKWYVKQKTTDYYNKKEKTPIHKILKKAKKQVLKLLGEYKPDVVFCTHVECAQIMSDLKKAKLTDVKTVSLITDYDIQPYTETTTAIDYIIVPNEDFIEGVEKKHFKTEQIKPLGIPVSLKFSNQLDKAAIREELGLDKDKFTIFMMSGGVGFVRNDKFIKDFMKNNLDVQIISVCGHNKKLKRMIDRLAKKDGSPKIKNYGYSDSVPYLMSASDCMVGKIGGVSINECFNRMLPIVATERLPWQEYFNMKYMTSRDAMIYMDNQKYPSRYIAPLIEDPSKLQELKSNIEKVRKPHATRDIGDFLIEVADKHE